MAVLTLGSVSITSAPGKKYWVQASVRSPVFSKPSLKSKVVGYLSNEQVVTLIEKSKKKYLGDVWVRIRRGKTQGWVSAYFLHRVNQTLRPCERRIISTMRSRDPAKLLGLFGSSVSWDPAFHAETLSNKQARAQFRRKKGNLFDILYSEKVTAKVLGFPLTFSTAFQRAKFVAKFNLRGNKGIRVVASGVSYDIFYRDKPQCQIEMFYLEKIAHSEETYYESD